MKICVPALWICTMCFVSCGRVERAPNKQTIRDSKARAASQKADMVSQEAAISIAKADANQVYRSLEQYNIVTYKEAKMWRVIFELKDPGLDGGGPEYLIDKETGKILHKAYYK